MPVLGADDVRLDWQGIGRRRAIALAPRAAGMATLWSLLPALIVTIGFHSLMPGLLN